MAHQPKPEVEAAKAEWMAAPRRQKPAALDLARRHGVAESTIHRARVKWVKEQRKAAKESIHG
jgi:hypothetical protein